MFYLFATNFRYFGKSKSKHELTVHGLEAAPPFTEHVNPSAEQTNVLQDDMYNYQCSLLDQGLFYMSFIDATAEGDGNRIVRCWKFLLLHFLASKKTKYAIQAQYFLMQQFCLLSQRQAYHERWNRSTNNKGGSGNNVPLDLEHDNNYLKQALRKLGPNLTQSGVSGCGKILKLARNKVEDISRECAMMKRSGKHFIKNPRRDMAKLVNNLIEKDALVKQYHSQ